MSELWEQDEDATTAAQKADLQLWQRDILKLANSEEWLSLRKLLLYREKQANSKLYTQNISRQEMTVGKLIGKAGAYREIINLPQEIQEATQ